MNKKVIISGIIAVVAFIAIAAVLGGTESTPEQNKKESVTNSEEASTNPQPVSNQATQEESPINPQPTYSKPQILTPVNSSRVVVGDLAYTVHKIEIKPYVEQGALGMDTEGMLVTVYLTVDNLGKETKQIFYDMVKIQDSQGNKYETSTTIFHRYSIYFKDIQPGMSYTGEAEFFLPKGVGKIYLNVASDSLFFAKTELIELGTI